MSNFDILFLLTTLHCDTDCSVCTVQYVSIGTFGCLVRTLALPHASDWSVRRSSPSSTHAQTNTSAKSVQYTKKRKTCPISL